MVLTAFTLALFFSATAQQAKSDSVLFKENLERFINKEFLTLTSNTELSQLESQFKIKLNTLGSCYVVFSHANLESAEKTSLTTRIEEIAKLLFDEGTPIYLSIGGSQSLEWTAEQQKSSRMSNVTFVSLGNYCVVEKREELFERIFNQKTLALLGIENVE